VPTRATPPGVDEYHQRTQAARISPSAPPPRHESQKSWRLAMSTETSMPRGSRAARTLGTARVASRGRSPAATVFSVALP